MDIKEIQAWRTIVAILRETGYDKLYDEDVHIVAECLHRCEQQCKKQKEFIKYLKDEIKQNTPRLRWKHYNEDGFNDYDVENSSCMEIRPTYKVLELIFQRYKSIIGDDK